MRTDTARTLGRGAAAGAGATAVMSGWMLAAQRAGWIGKLPPEKITEKALDAAELPRTERTEDLLSALAHFGYGAAGGAAFSALARTADRPKAIGLGVLFGLAVWAGSYFGWVPAMGVMPRPDRDWKARQATMIIAHVLYGGVLGALAGGNRTAPRTRWRGR